MKIDKILMDFFKKIGRMDSLRVLYYEDPEYMYFSPDGFRAYKIPVNKFVFDMSKALPKHEPTESIKKFFDDSNSQPGEKTSELRIVPEGKKDKSIVKIANSKTYAWVKMDYLREYESYCTFKISSPKSPVFVYEGDELVGLVLPVNVKEGA